jgi:hypothetical protein
MDGATKFDLRDLWTQPLGAGEQNGHSGVA